MFRQRNVVCGRQGVMEFAVVVVVTAVHGQSGFVDADPGKLPTYLNTTIGRRLSRSSREAWALSVFS